MLAMVHRHQQTGQPSQNCSTTCRMKRRKKGILVLLLELTSKSHSWGSSQGKNETSQIKRRTKGHRHILLIYHCVKHRQFFKILDVICSQKNRTKKRRRRTLSCKSKTTYRYIIPEPARKKKPSRKF